MQKGKHQGGPLQGHPSRNYSAYPGNPDNTRQYSREVPAFHASGTPGGGPGMRGMHHAPPTQPPTPPTSQDIKQPPAHLPPQAHQIPSQSGAQMMQYGMSSTGRGSNPQSQYFSPPRPNQRMAPHGRPSVVMSNSTPSFVSQPVVPPVYHQQHVLSTQMSGQSPMFVAPPMSQAFPLAQTRHQGGTFYPPQQILVPQHTMFTHYSQPPMYYTQPIQTMSRPGGPAPSSQGGAPAQPQPPLTLIASHGGPIISNSGVSQPVKTSRPKKILDIINPSNGRNVLHDMNDNDNASSRSGESSARQTPQPPVTITHPVTGRDVLNDFKNEIASSVLQESSEGIFPEINAGQKTDQGLAADFATRVAIAARGDHSGSPNSPALQQTSSRTSNYSERESEASPDPQGMSTLSVSPSKLDSSVESASSDGQIVENNITYDTNQQASMIRSGWGSVLTGGTVPVEILPMSIHSGMVIPDDMMRGPLPNQPAREYQAVQPQWIADPNPVPVVITKEPSQIESPVRPGPERVTPVVSALTQGPTVEIGPRPQREQFPALGKGHQQQSPVKRKQRLEQAQEQMEGKVKDQLPKASTQSKAKSLTPTVESKKQSTLSSQEKDEFVQSVQTKDNEPKPLSMKKNDSDNSGTKTKSNDSLKNKESNNLETRNLNEDIVQENNNLNKSEKIKCEVALPREKSPAPAPEESTASPAVAAPAAATDSSVGKIISEETQESVSLAPGPESEVHSIVAEDSVSPKANGEATEEDTKSSNQKSKTGNKRPAQSKMRLESKDSRNAEPEAPAIEAAPSASPVPETKNSAPSTVVASEQSEKTQEEPLPNEDKEKEDLFVAAKNEENVKQMASLKSNDSNSAAPNKVVLKHTYEVDQWSPLNPEGKKKYDRQFIMGLQNEPHSLRKPTNFPNLDLLNDNNKQRSFDRSVINSMNRSHVDSLYPPFANKNSSQRGGQAITKRGSQQGKPKTAKPAVVQVSLQQDIKLHETENAWKPTRITDQAKRTEEETKTESLYKSVRGILNKLTPEKFNKLVAQVRDLPIDNQERLDGVIDLVFKKAVDEPSFSVAYAQMCRTLQKMEVPSDTLQKDGTPEPVNFRKLLLFKCQKEFEKNSAAELKRDEREKEIELEKDPEKKKMLQLTFEEEERRIRMKSVGNIRFIGELYKMNMLTCGIMHSCVDHLLNQGDEESLECLCKLLTTIGQGLESKEKANKNNQDKGKGDENTINGYFKKLGEIVKNKGSGKVSSRVRFMIQDLIDLRNNKWVPRRNESQPKTIEQIQKEAERESMEKNLALNSPQERNKRQDMRNSVDNRKRGGPDSSGWTTVMGSQQNKSKYVVEYSKLKLDQSDLEVAPNVSLGNRTQFIWGQGASSCKSDEMRSMSQLSANKFALLSSSGNSSMKGTSSSEKDKINNSYKSLDDDLRSSRGGNQQDSRSSSRESASSKRDDSRYTSSTNKVQPAPTQNVARVEDLPKESDEEIAKKTKRLLEEYMYCCDVTEAERDLKQWFPGTRKGFVTSIFFEAMEMRDSNAKKRVAVLMNYFITNDLILKDEFLVGLSKVLETADDLTIDMPFVWEYIAEILVHIFAEKVMTFRDLVPAVACIRGTTGVVKVLSALVKLLIKAKNVDWLKTQWMKSEIQLSSLIDEKDIPDFIKQNNVEFMSIKTVKSELSRLINAKATFDEITAWVSENVGEEESSEPSFVRTLMTVLLEASVTSKEGQSSSYKLDASILSHYEQLIVRYTNHSEELELPCLFAIQAFLHKLEHPQAILHNIFNHLWDGGLIAAETFKAWRNSTNAQEQEGHAVCVTSLKSFFTHLSEPETDEDQS